ncbi:PMS1 protein homolog 1-like isoform X2 [Periplaneta americana]|uniref:PMS1 protein homolog 1-like isoform X2 n=1 Tax=Periplaneta americana TaxID=6978 RepID=UPI0037E96DA3
MSLKQLPVSTVKLITSSQIITSVTSAVKELVENALDAGASNIDVKLEHNGLDLIEVKDDGCGINRADTSNMCLSHYTSKINDFADLDKLQSYGFRGEALNALCSVADVTITTRTSEDEVAMTYTLNMNGNVVKTKPSHFGKVRKQYLSSGRRAAEELKRAENVVKSLAVIHPDLRLTFCHNKNLLWQKSSCTTLQQSLMQVVGHSVSSKLEVLGHQEMELTLDIMVPKKELENLASLCISYIDCMMMYINHRPVRYKKLEKLLLKYIGKCFPGQLRAHKYPYCLVSIVTSPGETDVNLEPNKTKVLLKEEDGVLSKIESMLASYYNSTDNIQQTPAQASAVEENGETHQRNPDLKICSQENPGKGVKRMRLDNGGCNDWNKSDFPLNRVQNTEVVVTELGKEIFQNEKGISSVNSVTDNEKNLVMNDVEILNDENSNPENLGYNELLTTNASHVANEGWTVITNTKTDSNRVAGNEYSHRENGISIDSNVHPSNLNNQTSNKPCEPSNYPSDLNNQSTNNDHCEPSVVLPCSKQSSTFEGNGISLHNGCKEIVNKFDGNSVNIHNTETSLDSVAAITNGAGETIAGCENNDESGIKSNMELDTLPVLNLDDDTEFCSSIHADQVAAPVDKNSENTNYNNQMIHTTSDAIQSHKASAVSDDVCKAADLVMEKWSKGQLKAENGKIIQGSAVLLPKANATPKSLDSSCISASSQMGCKEQSAFTKFSRQERPKILQEFPGIAFTKVAEVLVNRWQNLTSEERAKYEELAKEMDEKRKSSKLEEIEHKLVSVKKFYKPVSKVQRSMKRAERRKEIMNVSLEILQENSVPVQKTIDKNPRPVLIGQLKPSGTWLYHKDKELGIVRHWALQEVVHYHRLMMDHSIPLKKLESSIQFDESTLGAELWKVLLSQSKTYDVITSAVIITSDAISKNGFRIELVEGLGKTLCVLTDVASTINFYGINDLKNTLELIKTHGSSSLMKCRSLSVVNYIKGETVRIVRQCPSKMEKETLQDLIHYWHLNLSHLEASCLHGKPIFHAIKYLSEL